MLVYPENLSQQIDFEIIRSKLLAFCMNEDVSRNISDLKPISDFPTLLSLLEECNETLLLHHKGIGPPVDRIPFATPILKWLRIEESVLSARQCTEIRKVISLCQELRSFFQEFEEQFPRLRHRSSRMEEDDLLIPAIDELIDEQSVVKDDASPTLFQLRKELHQNRLQAERMYRSHIQRLHKLGYLDTITESFISGRRVLAILSEHKRQVKGIIHGQSSTGKITYIEPQNLISINNDRLILEEQETEEIQAILKGLSNFLRPFHPRISAYYNILLHFHLLYCKAMLAKEMDAVLPLVREHGLDTQWEKAYNPVLFLQNKERKLKTEPFHCSFNSDQRIMVISGPNAGGKSVTLKSIGLLQFMIQCGLLVPASAKSIVSMKHKLLGDIGDNQSMEDGLSTYSSRLIKMKYFLEHADAGTLFLIDEFGTGSDPDMGGALAEVILDHLNDAGAQGVVTTHYTNLKLLASHKPGIYNCCMLFNPGTLKPLYQLQIGEPGSSFTFEVAEKIGLKQSYLQEAKEKLSGEKLKMDQLLNSLQKEKNALLKQRRDLQKQIGKVAAEKRSYQELSEKMEDSFIESLKDREEKKKLMEFGKKLMQLTDEWMEGKNRKEIIEKFVKLAGYELHLKKAREAYEKTEKFRETRIAKIKPRI
ncbi:MAG TPA: hypothetical protein PLP14_07910, partial [Chitinophagaceae bacterium]|nr:hypothetical protein [Chitinophagaceae bacterium]